MGWAAPEGSEPVITSTDCGFATFAGWCKRHPRVALGTQGHLREGARPASTILWSRAVKKRAPAGPKKFDGVANVPRSSG